MGVRQHRHHSLHPVRILCERLHVQQGFGLGTEGRAGRAICAADIPSFACLAGGKEFFRYACNRCCNGRHDCLLLMRRRRMMRSAMLGTFPGIDLVSVWATKDTTRELVPRWTRGPQLKTLSDPSSAVADEGWQEERLNGEVRLC